MSTEKSFDKVCWAVLFVTLLLTVVFLNAGNFGVSEASPVMGYEGRLFDTSTVHTIDIVMEDWEEFISQCESEEYNICTVVIDDETYKNVAIRGKGNTSLTQVAAYGNDRYSFKVEFDHYDSTKTYYGLDKLCLNNMIQDHTYMKDYVSYQMMAVMGVASPLCSYVYLTVNGEDWGLYLAVEGVEESFLQRNYGSNYGELYKPDSMDMGGGRGNGEKFRMDDFVENADAGEDEDAGTGQGIANDTAGQTVPEIPDGIGAVPPDMGGQGIANNIDDQGSPEIPNGIGAAPPDMGGQTPDDIQGGQIPDGMPSFPEGDTMEQDEPFPDGEPPQSEAEQAEDGAEPSQGMQKPAGNIPGESPGDFGNGNADVLLKYIDDNADSYANIFENAKTDITEGDKTRLIKALEKLNNKEDLENTVDVDAVIRYFVAHNFVLNFDSYTGAMIHNYYLYEESGQMQMIPWDYNLAFGGFESAGGATTLVNYPIDSPVSGGSTEDRPMIAWIFENEEYQDLYHQYFAEFIEAYFDNGYFEEMMDQVSTMIAPYVEKDPTKFCTYEEFETGVSTLREFCILRAESIRGQLNGTIGSTSDTQSSDAQIDAGSLQITDMGSMNNSMMGGGFPAHAFQSTFSSRSYCTNGQIYNHIYEILPLSGSPDEREIQRCFC